MHHSTDLTEIPGEKCHLMHYADAIETVKVTTPKTIKFMSNQIERACEWNSVALKNHIIESSSSSPKLFSYFAT